jgi:response regulator of citrate/malate metabolism
MLDDAGIDLNFLPFNVQIKAGYAKGLNEFKTLKIIREIETKGSHVEVIMITGMTDAQNIRDSFKCGCTKLMTKPLVTQELHEAMKAMRWSKL